LGSIDDVIRPLFGGFHDLGALHHSFGSGARLFDDVVSFMARSSKEFFAFL
jgi:hypothetical protein